MAYKLMLTSQERRAVDFIGYRYSNGDDLYDALWGCCRAEPEGEEWGSGADIEFTVPEHIAWRIAENAQLEDGDSEYTFPCFSGDLTAKMQEFCWNII